MWSGASRGNLCDSTAFLFYIIEILLKRKIIGNHVWSIKWHDCQWPWVRPKATFAVLNLCNNSGNIACFNYNVFTHNLERAHSLWYKLYCQMWSTFQGHRQSRSLRWKSGNISETVLDRDVVTTGHQQEVTLVYGLSNISNLMTLSVLEGFLLQAVSSAVFRDFGASRGSSASAELLVNQNRSLIACSVFTYKNVGLLLSSNSCNFMCMLRVVWPWLGHPLAALR